MHRISTLSLSATVLIFGSVFFLAPLAAQAALFAPGATLDPGCPPTDISNCGIATSTQVTVATLSATTTLPGIVTLPNLTTVSTSLTGFLKATAGVLSTALVNLASDVTGILPVSNGGTGVSAIKSGFIPFGNGTAAVATSSALYFDAANGFLGVGTSLPSYGLDVVGTFRASATSSLVNVALGGKTTGARSNEPDFTIVLFPDTQYMVQSYTSVWQSMPDWVVANKSSQNIVAVVSLGDVTNTASAG